MFVKMIIKDTVPKDTVPKKGIALNSFANKKCL